MWVNSCVCLVRFLKWDCAQILSPHSPLGQELTQIGETLAGSGADKLTHDGLAIRFDPGLQLQGAALGRQRIEFVEDQDLGNMVGANFVQHALHLLDLLGMIGVRGIHHMQEQIGIGGLLERGFERVHQAVG